jgi:Zn-dependent protease with chaperone function
LDSSSSQDRTPDPFALPSETDAHFTLLIVGVVGSSILLYSIVFNTIPFFWDAKQADIARCAEVVAQAIPGTDILREEARRELRAGCERPGRLVQAAWEIGGCLVLIALALGLYWWLPGRIMRRSGFRPLTRSDDAELVDFVAQLSSEVGLRQPPTLVCNPLNRSGGGVAFGHWGRRFLGLYGGTLLRFRRQPEQFRAVVLHELAHLRNADVDKAVFAVTVWWAFLAVAVVPTAITILLGGLWQPDRAFGLVVRLLIVAALVVLTRAAVLRERELYADQRAAGWGSEVGLADALAGLAGPKRARGWPLPEFVHRAFALHPQPAERVVTLSEPAALFQFSPWTAFAAGLVTTLALGNIEQVVDRFVSGLTGSVVGTLVVAVPLAGVLTLSVWRDHQYGRRRHSITALGLSLGAGIWVGWHASLVFFALEASPRQLQGVARAIWEIGFIGVVAVCMVLFVAWLRACAQAWLPRAGGPYLTARTALAFATFATALLLTGVLAYMSSTLAAGVVGLPDLDRSSLVVPMADLGFLADLSPEQSVLVLVFGVTLLQLTWLAVTPFALATIWAFPLASGFASREVDHRPRWRLVCVISVAAGLAALVVFLALVFTTVDPENTFAFAIIGPSVFGLFQIGAALIVQARVPHLATFHALATAQLTGYVTVAVLLALAGLAGTALPWQVVGSLANGGMLLACIAVLAFAPILGWLRREQPAPAVELAR